MNILSSEDGGVMPLRAAVQPIVHSMDGDVVRLERVLAPVVERATKGSVAIVGGAASGKTTALLHLASLELFRGRLRFLDEPDAKAVESVARNSLVVYSQNTSNGPDSRNELARYELAPWGMDQWIEYALARHRERCGSIMARMRACKDAESMEGSPLLIACAIDRFASDETLASVEAAIRSFLAEELKCSANLHDARTHALQFFFDGLVVELNDAPFERLARGCSRAVLQALRLQSVRRYLATDRVLADLAESKPPRYLVQRFDRLLIEFVARQLDESPSRRRNLLSVLMSSKLSHLHATGASLLAATPAGWRPDGSPLPDLKYARLRGVQWAKLDMTRAQIELADFSFADLSEADLENAFAAEAVFAKANLHGANLRKIHASHADFSNADLSHARAVDGLFRASAFIGANLSGALLGNAEFDGANLTKANLTRADLTSAVLTGAVLDECDLSAACLEHARLDGSDLRTVILSGTSFRAVCMSLCNLEQQHIVAPDFSLADLQGSEFTASVMPNANFRDANLRETGLADIEWENADLRGADLSNCSFHLGSTRCGRVDSPIASEGTRTGFYTDEYEEQSYRAAEDIRKANLRGADLRGANIENTDFYLVDLRDAKYDSEQEAHFRACGAILETRV